MRMPVVADILAELDINNNKKFSSHVNDGTVVDRRSQQCDSRPVLYLGSRSCKVKSEKCFLAKQDVLAGVPSQYG